MQKPRCTCPQHGISPHCVNPKHAKYARMLKILGFTPELWAKDMPDQCRKFKRS